MTRQQLHVLHCELLCVLLSLLKSGFMSFLVACRLISFSLVSCGSYYLVSHPATQHCVEGWSSPCSSSTRSSYSSHPSKSMHPTSSKHSPSTSCKPKLGRRYRSRLSCCRSANIFFLLARAPLLSPLLQLVDALEKSL